MKAAAAVRQSYLMNTYGRLPVTFVTGRETRLYDLEGRPYLDFVAGVGVNALGHCHPEVVETVQRQASLLVHTSNLYSTGPADQLAERLCRLLEWPDGRVFFGNSGAEANECAFKLVRKWSRTKFGPERYVTIAAQGSFHGRTLQTLAATGQPAKWEPFLPMPEGFEHVPYDDAAALESACNTSTAAVVLEPIQGEGGIRVPEKSYFSSVRHTCDSRHLAFIDDEVQTGLGRTGAWFGFQNMSGPASPDVVTLAKALGGGLPIGACVARGEFAEVFVPGDHASTTGGGPLVCAVALTVLETIETLNLLDNARVMGDYLTASLRKLIGQFQVVDEVRGKGLLIGIQLKSPVARRVVETALGQGLLVNDVTPSVVRLCPPLIVSKQDCDEAREILERAFLEAEEAA